jgi:hypothetical protein
MCSIPGSLLAATLLLGLLLGCAGSGVQSKPTSQGRVTLTVTWPASRAIPSATQSIKITVKVLEPTNGPEVAQRIILRPEGQATSQLVLEDIPSVKVRITATAYATTDATGTALATGSTDAIVPENSAVTASLTLTDSSGGAAIQFLNVDEGNIRHLALCTQGHRWDAQVDGLSNEAVTWSATGGGVIENPQGPNLDGISSMQFHTGHVEGAFAITVRSAENPSLLATQPFIADPMTGSGWGAGSPYVGVGPNANGKYEIRERIGFARYLLTKSGSTYSGPLIDGQPGEMMQATLVSVDHLTGFTKRKLGDSTLETQTFDLHRECFDTD